MRHPWQNTMPSRPANGQPPSPVGPKQCLMTLLVMGSRMSTMPASYITSPPERMDLIPPILGKIGHQWPGKWPRFIASGPGDDTSSSRSPRRHPQRTVEPDHLTVEHAVVDDVGNK